MGAAFFLCRRLKDIQSDYWESRAPLRNSVILSFSWRRTHRLDKCRLNRVSVADTGDVLRRVFVIVGRICVCGLLIQKVYDKHSRARRGGLNLKKCTPSLAQSPTTGVTAENWPCFAKLSSHTYNMKVTVWERDAQHCAGERTGVLHVISFYMTPCIIWSSVIQKRRPCGRPWFGGWGNIIQAFSLFSHFDNEDIHTSSDTVWGNILYINTSMCGAICRFEK